MDPRGGGGNIPPDVLAAIRKAAQDQVDIKWR